MEGPDMAGASRSARLCRYAILRLRRSRMAPAPVPNNSMDAGSGVPSPCRVVGVPGMVLITSETPALLVVPAAPPRTMMSLETASVETGENETESKDLMPPELSKTFRDEVVPPQNPLLRGTAPTHILSVTCTLPLPLMPNPWMDSASPLMIAGDEVITNAIEASNCNPAPAP